MEGILRIERTKERKDEEMTIDESDFICRCCILHKHSGAKLNSLVITKRRSTMCLSNCLHLTRYLLVVLIWHHFVSHSEGFNLDTTKAVTYTGPNSGSYFGFTVEMMNKDSRNKWILFGAPKDDNKNLQGTTEPGAIYKETFNSDGSTFEEVFIDDKVSTDSVRFNGSLLRFEHGRDHQWLGASIDVNKNQGVVVCASRWYNRYFEIQDKILFMNGICYLVPLDFNQNNIKKIPALIGKAKQTKGEDEWNWGMGCLGSSAHYTSSGNDVLLGAPGLWDWTGGFVDLRQSKSYITKYDYPPTDLNEMAGYAISSGIYFKDGITYFAIGAPRQHLVGAVYFFSSIKTSLRLSEADLVLDGTLETGIEMPVNSFFGASLCTEDVNNDGQADLLVGATMYSQLSTKDTEYVEEGAVFVFLGGEKAFQANPTVLRGSEAKMARFGTAISSIGDLNMDTYNDIVIGAPYENDNEGAIYVYNGCKKGIYPTYSQRIPGAAVFPGIKSFGAALSKSFSMNDDDVNDISVGAYLSDKAFLLHGQPVINLALRIIPSVRQIDKDSSVTCSTMIDGKRLSVPCFQLKVCASYRDVDFASVDATVAVVLDMYKGEYYRISFEENRVNEISQDIRIFSGEEKCTRNWNIFIRSTSDLVTLVMVSARLDQRRIQSSTDIKPTLNVFDGNNPDEPVLSKRTRLDFKKDCPNNNCQTDLKLAVEKYFTSEKGFFILGTSALDLIITITKSGHPSYGSTLFIIVHKDVQFRKAQKLFGEPEINCGYVVLASEEGESDGVTDEESDIHQLASIPDLQEHEKLLSCSFGNPMAADEGVKFKLTLVIPGDVSTTFLPFRLNATTHSTEIKAEDNVVEFNIEAKNQVTTEFNGVAKPSFITLKDDENIYTASHVLELSNNGPSILPEADLTVRYSQVQRDGKAQLYLNKTMWSCRPPCKITCSFPDTERVSPVVHLGGVGPTYYVDESPVKIGESKELTTVNKVDCTKTTCSRYECTLRNISPRESAVVSLEFVIHKDVLDVLGAKAITFTTDAYVRFRMRERLITNETDHSTSVFTDVQPKSPPPEPVAWWIILVSVLAGLVLIALLVVILWKVGFFKRKKKEDLEKMQQQATLKEAEPMLTGEEEADQIKKEPL